MTAEWTSSAASVGVRLADGAAARYSATSNHSVFGNSVTDKASKPLKSSAKADGPAEHLAALDDETLVQRVRGGDRPAFGVLVGRYQDRVFNLVLRMCSRRAEAEELAQEVFLRALERIEQFQGRSRFYTWLFRIATNLTISHRRRGQRVKFHPIDGFEEDAPAGRTVAGSTAQHREPSPVSSAIATETRDIVAEALASLDEPFRIVLVLRDMQDMDYAEVAEVLDVPVGTVKSRLFRARCLLRERLEGHQP
jgi:RNA polymerase sigma-70 factor, ECF subfamily